MKTRTTRASPAFLVRLPDDMAEIIRGRAAAGYRSANAQILMMLDQAIAAEKTASELAA
jgi:hypothetical protein